MATDRAPLLFSSTLNVDGLVAVLRNSCIVAYSFDGLHFSLHVQSSFLKLLTSEELWDQLRQVLRYTGNYLKETAPGVHVVERVRRVNELDKLIYFVVANGPALRPAVHVPRRELGHWYFSTLCAGFFDELDMTSQLYFNHDLCTVVTEFIHASPSRRSEIYKFLFAKMHPYFKTCLFSTLQAAVIADKRRLAFGKPCKPPSSVCQPTQ